MKSKLFLAILLLLYCSKQIQAQEEFVTGALPLTEAEMAKIPALRLSTQSAMISLPDSVSNNWRIYFPPIYNQQQTGCCVQAAEIGYTFTYEINRLRNVAA